MSRSDPLLETNLREAREIAKSVAHLEERWQRVRESILGVLDRLHQELGKGTAAEPSPEPGRIEFRFLGLPCFARFVNGVTRGWVEYGVYPNRPESDRRRLVVQRVEFVANGNTTDGSGLAVEQAGLHVRTLVQSADELFRAYTLGDGTGYMKDY